MILQNTIKITGLYTGKSKFAFFRNLMVGDIIKVSIDIKDSGKFGYRPTFMLTNPRTNEIQDVYFAEYDKYMGKIPHETFKDTYTRPEVVTMLEDVYAETAGNHNDYGKDKYDYLDDAKNEIAAYMKNR